MEPRKSRLVFAAAALAGAFALTGLMAPAGAVGINAPVGVVCPNTNSNVSVYMTGVDNTLRSRYWTGSTWAWVNHGVSGLGVGPGVGAAIINGVSPIAFTIGLDGKLWSRDNNYTASGWTWVYHGLPGSVAGINFGVGVTNHKHIGSDRPTALIVGSDGNLWSRGRTPGWSWDNLGAPSGGVTLASAVGVTSVKGPSTGADWDPYGFMVGSDGNLWSAFWNGSIWSWVNHGAPAGGVAAGVGATAISGGERPFAYIKGNDGNLWSRNWSGSAWSWYNHGTPAGLSIAAGMGVTYANNNTQPFAFIKASDGNLWSNHWNGSSWVWTNHGTPAGVGLAVSMGAIAVNNKNPYVYVTGSDGNLWLRWWSGSAWAWYNNGQP